MKPTICLSIILAAVAAVAVPRVTAQEPRDNEPQQIYSLEECRRLALSNNASMRTSENDLKAAEETRKAAFTKYFPEVMAGASAFQANHDMLQYDVLDLFTLGVIKKGRAAGIWAMQPVFAGGRIVNGNKLAGVGKEVAALRQEQTADNVTLETDRLYWSLATLKATRLTVESAIQMLDSLAAEVGAAVEAGIVVRNELLKVDLKRNQYRNDLVDLDNGINLMRMLLAQQMGLGPESGIDISETVPDAVPAFPDRLFIDRSSAVTLTTDHRLLIKNVEAKSLERKMEVGNYLPEIGIGAGWVFHNIFRQNHNFGAVMVSVTVPISGWWGGSHNIKKKTLELENARTELTDLTQKLEIEISDCWDNLTGAYRKMELSSEDIAQSAENLRITAAYYEAGMNTISDLLEAQTLHVESQSGYISAYGSFMMSVSRYLEATGRLQTVETGL